MHGTSNLGDLKARIAQRQREERERSEELEAAKNRMQAATAGHLRQHEKWLEGELRKSREAQSRLLRQHVERSSGNASAALSTIERDTAAALARKDAMLQRAWLRTLTIGALKGLILVVGILLGISGLTRWLAGDIQSQIEARSALVAEIAAQRETVRRLEGKTWGITLRQLSNGRFVVLPADSLDHPPWTVEGKPAVKLSSD